MRINCNVSPEEIFYYNNSRTFDRKRCMYDNGDFNDRLRNKPESLNAAVDRFYQKIDIVLWRLQR